MEQLSLDDSGNEGTDGTDAQVSLAEDETIDFITGKPVKLKGNEEVRQRIARGLYTSTAFRVEDMERDFPIRCPRRAAPRRPRRRTSRSSSLMPSTPSQNLRRVVICKPEPKGGRAVTKIRTYSRREGSRRA